MRETWKSKTDKYNWKMQDYINIRNDMIPDYFVTYGVLPLSWLLELYEEYINSTRNNEAWNYA